MFGVVRDVDIELAPHARSSDNVFLESAAHTLYSKNSDIWRHSYLPGRYPLGSYLTSFGCPGNNPVRCFFVYFLSVQRGKRRGRRMEGRRREERDDGRAMGSEG